MAGVAVDDALNGGFQCLVVFWKGGGVVLCCCVYGRMGRLGGFSLDLGGNGCRRGLLALDFLFVFTVFDGDMFDVSEHNDTGIRHDFMVYGGELLVVNRFVLSQECLEWSFPVDVKELEGVLIQFLEEVIDDGDWLVGW